MENDLTTGNSMKKSIAGNILTQFQIIAGEIEDVKKKIGTQSDPSLPVKLKFAEVIQLLRIDGYPNISKMDFEQIPDKDLNWFLNRVDYDVYMANQAGIGGVITIEDKDFAAMLFQQAPAQGFKVLSKTERIKSVLGRGYYYLELLSQKPKLANVYEYRFYLNGELKEKSYLVYKGYSDNAKFYIFSNLGNDEDAIQSLDETNDNAEWFKRTHEIHLLTTEKGSFPFHLKKIGTDLFSFEHFDLNEKATIKYYENSKKIIYHKLI